MLADVQRRELLAAMGIDIYVLRSSAAAATDAQRDDASNEVVVMCRYDPLENVHAARLRSCLPAALGIESRRIRWLHCRDPERLPELPAARACLILGTELVDAVRPRIAANPSQATMIAVAGAPDESLRDASGRRALWHALKPLRRHLLDVQV